MQLILSKVKSKTVEGALGISDERKISLIDQINANFSKTQKEVEGKTDEELDNVPGLTKSELYQFGVGISENLNEVVFVIMLITEALAEMKQAHEFPLASMLGMVFGEIPKRPRRKKADPDQPKLN